MSDLDNFRKLGISEITLEALRRKGFEEPSPIQEQTIPRLLAGEKDIIGQAQTGTGKTAAFGIPILETVERGDGSPGALILSPTRELSIQIAEELNSLKGTRPLRIAALYGGQNIEIQLQRLRDGIDIVIGTPGRVIDLIERGKLRLDKLQFTVLDEADEMLNMGFIEDIERILADTPQDKRMLMFSATMPPEILAIAKRFMREYEVIRTIRNDDAPELTEQIYFEVRRENKLEALSRIIDMEEDIYAMVFCRTRNDVDELTE
ncbi:MAG: DEAD/DEAH box helicase, partial [Victivallaceae bacterium]